jgi:hypothetical protein
MVKMVHFMHIFYENIRLYYSGLSDRPENKYLSVKILAFILQHKSISIMIKSENIAYAVSNVILVIKVLSPPFNGQWWS